MLELIFIIGFPIILLIFLIVILISGRPNRRAEQDFMSCDDFIKDWLRDHGQAHKVEEQFAQMKKDPAGLIYMPLTYKGAKVFIKWGLSPNKVSIMNLIFSLFIFYGVLVAGLGHTLDILTEQPIFGFWFVIFALLVLFTGLIDGIDGAIARLLDKKSKSGAWFDNIIDRVSDTLMLVCLIPTGFSILSGSKYDFKWMIWTNIFIIFLYEYMRARHEGLGLHETKPFIGERITRILIIATFFAIYGVSSLTVLLTSLINPDAAAIWESSHTGITTWCMFIFQITLLAIMIYSVIGFGKYIWKNLKKMDNEK
ncbi:MAG: CDP-alcohol phosphatidyltransferase family protein [Promethearchaeota archaeon]